ncbi:CheY-like superfamily protein [Tribonema minus]|uniref:CheY-like superfamily protein n=1 Tax=Tribonema minus TaxID=303371 RepID=A0A835YJV5_9STRA|nr:CheY-like superfamily protein [Tribonema minus]
MDLRMPVCDGLQATAIMRRELEVETPIVALSADSTEDIRQRCSAAGMQSFCSKPASKQEIAQVVKKFVVR